MKVVVATSSFPLHPDDSAAAAGLFIRDFVEEAALQGHDVRVLTQARRGEPGAPVQDPPGVRVVRYPWRGDAPLSTLRRSSPRDLLAIGSVLAGGFRALDRLVAAERPDRVVAMWAVPAGLFARRERRRRGIPYRVWVLGSDLWDYGRHPLTRAFVRRVLHDAEHVYADGLALAAEAERIGEVSCAFLPSSRTLARGQRAPVLEPGRRHFVFIGRLHPNKGIDLLIEAVAGLAPERRAALRLHVFGDGPLREVLEADVARRDLGGCVRLAGYAGREEATAMLEHAHALVIPSRVESIPLVLSDAAQAGCPIVATDVGDMGRVLREHGAGAVVAPTAEGIREGLLAAWDWERAQRASGLASLARVFSLGESVRVLLAEPEGGRG